MRRWCLGECETEVIEVEDGRKTKGLSDISRGKKTLFVDDAGGCDEVGGKINSLCAGRTCHRLATKLFQWARNMRDEFQSEGRGGGQRTRCGYSEK